MVQEVLEQASMKKTATIEDPASLLKEAIQTVYVLDLPWLAVKKQDRTPEFLVSAKPTADDYCIFRIKGRRLSRVERAAIVGYGTPVTATLLRRMYRPDLPMQQAVMLATYLVSVSKQMSDGVGGDTSVVLIRNT